VSGYSGAKMAAEGCPSTAMLCSAR